MQAYTLQCIQVQRVSDQLPALIDKPAGREELSTECLELNKQLTGLRSCLEAVQDVVGVDGISLWQASFQRVLEVSLTDTGWLQLCDLHHSHSLAVSNPDPERWASAGCLLWGYIAVWCKHDHYRDPISEGCNGVKWVKTGTQACSTP